MNIFSWFKRKTPEQRLLLKIATQIENHPKTYNQEVFGYECSSAHCIAGWACQITDGYLVRGRTHKRARKLLGLSEIDADRLFSAVWVPKPGLTPAQALRNLAEGATVDEVSGKSAW
jgi:hypothetical protein